MKAFPTLADNGHSDTQDGMDLRDYFAAKAMQALIMQLKSGKEHQIAQVPSISYDIADVMMNVRKK